MGLARIAMRPRACRATVVAQSLTTSVPACPDAGTTIFGGPVTARGGAKDLSSPLPAASPMARKVRPDPVGPGGLPPLSEQLQWRRRARNGSGRSLTDEDVEWVYQTLHSPAVPFDCGTKCREHNGGIPFCCDHSVAVPVAYEPELRLLERRTDLWHRWVPISRMDQRMVDEVDPYNIHVVCKGVDHCERDNRSISCRIFPFYPLTTRSGEILGLVYNEVLDSRCWLHDRQRMIAASFVVENLTFWHFLFEHLPEERELFVGISTQLRRTHSTAGTKPQVLRPEGIFEAPTRDGEGPLRYLGPLESHRLGLSGRMVPIGVTAQ